jgi:hypothetical protein
MYHYFVAEQNYYKEMQNVFDCSIVKGAVFQLYSWIEQVPKNK